MFALIIFMEASKKEPINWFPSYAAQHKIPYGTYVLANEFKEVFKNTTVTTILRPPYQFLKDTTLYGTYFFVNGSLNFGKPEFNELLKVCSTRKRCIYGYQRCHDRHAWFKNQTVGNQCF